jgi:hypothetical protein
MLRLRLPGVHFGLLLATGLVATLGGACGSSANPASPDAGDASVVDGPSSDAPSTTPDAAEASTGCPPSPVVYDGGAPITVHGTVYSQGGGAAAVQVTVQGKTVTSAADGTFTIAGVTPPYDVVMDDLTFNNHTAYLGLTRPDPSLLANALPAASAKYAQQVSGSVTVGGAVVDAGASQLVGAAIDLVSGSDEHVGGQLQSTFLLGGGWSAGPLATATLEGFTANLLPTGGPQAFTAQGTQVLTLDGGAAITGVDIAASAAGLSATSLSGTLTLPSGNVNPTITLSLGHGGQTAVTLPADALGDAGGSLPFSYGTFASPLTWSITASANYTATQTYSGLCGVVQVGLAGSEHLDLTIPTTKTFVTPPNGASVDPACADFSWNPTPGAVYVFVVFGGDQGDAGFGEPLYLVVTGGSAMRMPWTLAAGSNNWSVVEIQAVGTIDDVAASFAAGTVINDTISNGVWGSEQFCMPGLGQFVTL